VNWLKVTRGARGVIWFAAANFAGYEMLDIEHRSARFDSSAMQQSARATGGILELLTLLIGAIMWDRLLELAERNMLDRRAAKEKEALER